MPNNSFDIKTGKVLKQGAYGWYCASQNQHMSTALGAALLGVEEALADMGRNSSIVSHGYQKLFTRQIFDMVSRGSARKHASW